MKPMNNEPTHKASVNKETIGRVVISLLIGLIATACAASSAATKPPTPSATSQPFNNHPTIQPLNHLTPPTPIPQPPTPTPTSTPQPPPPTPTPTPTPTPSLRQLTSGGCCVQPFFSPDSRQVLYLDKPSTDTPVGIYGLNLADPQPTPILVNKTIGFRSADRTLVITMAGDLARLVNEITGQIWSVDTGGNSPSISPDNRRLIWTATDQDGPYDRRRSDVWLANIDGSQPRLLLSLYGGGFSDWFPDSQRLLFVGRDNPDLEEVTLFVYDLQTGQRLNLFSHKHLRGIEVSPGGVWIVCFIAFADTPADNGVWVIKADGTARHQLDVPGFGAYRWRNDDTLLYIPMRASAEDSMQLWAVDAASGQGHPLTNPTALPFSIANGDWDVSPDGRYVVFVSSSDQNIWLITLP